MQIEKCTEMQIHSKIREVGSPKSKIALVKVPIFAVWNIHEKLISYQVLLRVLLRNSGFKKIHTKRTKNYQIIVLCTEMSIDWNMILNLPVQAWRLFQARQTFHHAVNSLFSLGYFFMHIFGSVGFEASMADKAK